MNNIDEPTSRHAAHQLQAQAACVRSIPRPIFGASQSTIASTWKPQRAQTMQRHRMRARAS